jgi:hypothetical protein
VEENLAGAFAAIYNVQMATPLVTALPIPAASALPVRHLVHGLGAGPLKGRP